MKGITDRQRQVLEVIVERSERDGFPPTLREVGEKLGIRSTNGVSDHIKALVRKGFLQRRGKSSRTIRATPQGLALLGRRTSDPWIEYDEGMAPAGHVQSPPEDNGVVDVELRGDAVSLGGSEGVVDVPLVGKVAAGAPILATQQSRDRVRIDRALLPDNHSIFALRVEGSSMIGDGIFDGDYVFVKQRSTAEPGSIVVALIEDEATVKRYYPEGDQIRFQPANPTMEPIYVRRRDFRSSMLLGVVAGVYRRMH